MKKLATISLTAIYGVLIALFIVAALFGSWLGRRIHARGDQDKDATTLATAAMGLLALLIAFTYSIALARYDLRRQTVLEEANAIGSAANFALMLPEAQRAPTLDLLRRYTKVRLELGAPFDPKKFARDVVTTGHAADRDVAPGGRRPRPPHRSRCPSTCSCRT